MEYAIALTGGIATGKSTVSDILQQFDFDIIDADQVAHLILNKQQENIAYIFGKEFISGNQVDRKKLGKLVFEYPDELSKLESLLHPLIKEEILKISEDFENAKKPYFVDLPLFFEKDNYPINRSVLVYATKEQQLSRLMNRNGYSKEEALSRIAAQMPIDTKVKLATYTIDNTQDLEWLKKECSRVKGELQCK